MISKITINLKSLSLITLTRIRYLIVRKGYRNASYFSHKKIIYIVYSCSET